MNPLYDILIPDETRAKLAEFEVAVRCRSIQPGDRLADALRHKEDFTTALLRTKQPLIYAESAVAGNAATGT